MRTEQTINGYDWLFSTNFRPSTVQERSLEGAVKVKRHGKARVIKPNATVSARPFFFYKPPAPSPHLEAGGFPREVFLYSCPYVYSHLGNRLWSFDLVRSLQLSWLLWHLHNHVIMLLLTLFSSMDKPFLGTFVQTQAEAQNRIFRQHKPYLYNHCYCTCYARCRYACYTNP
jgi:hypothetical protein